MKIVVLGGDGFCGWPTSLYLASRGHEVIIYDSLVRRDIDRVLGIESLTPISHIADRIRGTGLKFRWMNVKEYYPLKACLKQDMPDAIVHFAEQRSAPYSMLSMEKGRYTVENNVTATHNVLNAIVELNKEIHLVHLGTMGVYGYSGTDQPLPEGYVTAQFNGEDRPILYPPDPGSVYHMTKVLDQTMFQFYAKNWGLPITDLHQGIVWGTQTEETKQDERLINRFDYDGEYGTVLNRFIVQAAIREPLTVYGTGGQTRAFIHINDTVRCIELALNRPPAPGERVRIRNQVTETHRVIDLAVMISETFDVPIGRCENPRKEKAQNELRVESTFSYLGLKTTRLSESLVDEARMTACKYKDRINKDCILSNARW